MERVVFIIIKPLKRVRTMRKYRKIAQECYELALQVKDQSDRRAADYERALAERDRASGSGSSTFVVTPS